MSDNPLVVYVEAWDGFGNAVDLEAAGAQGQPLLLSSLVGRRCCVMKADKSGLVLEFAPPVEVHLSTRDCQPMTAETAAALGRAFELVREQYEK